MKRFLACLILIVCVGLRGGAQTRNAPFVDQQHFATVSKALSEAIFLNEELIVTSSLEANAGVAIQFWNVKTGECTRSLAGATGGVFALAMSDDRQVLASGGNGLVAFHGIADGKERGRIALPDGRILALAFLPHEQVLLAAGEGKQIHVVDPSAGKLLSSIPAHDETITCLAVSRDGKQVASGSYDGSVKLWDAVTRKLTKKLVANGGRVHGVAFSSDGQSLAAACANNSEGAAKRAEVALWTLQDTTKRRSLHEGGAPFTNVRFSPDDSLIAGARADGWIVAWNKEGMPCSRLEAHQEWVTSLHFSPSGNTLLTTSWDSEARLWDLPRWKPPTLLPGEFGRFAALLLAPQSNLLLAGGTDKTVRALDPSGKQPVREYQTKSDATLALAVSPNGKMLATGSGRQDAAPQLARARVGGVPQPPSSKPEVITLIELASGKELRLLVGHRGPVHALAFSPDSQVVASASADKTVRLWNAASGDEQMQLIGHASPVSGLAFHPGGQSLASVSDDGSIRIWDLRTGQEKRVLLARPGSMNDLAYSPDGRWLAAASAQDRMLVVALWDAQTGEKRWQVSYPGVYVSGVEFSPDGQRLFSLGGTSWESGLIAVFDAGSGRRCIDLLGGKSRLLAFCLSADGKALYASGVSSSDKGELWRWTLPASTAR